MATHRDNLRAARPSGPGLLALAAFAVTVALFGAGCPASYPACETDKDCHTKEFCVANKCQQCRDSNDCPAGQACKANKCEPIPGYCRSKADCPANQECIASKCKACANDKECPGGQHCVKGTCSAKKPCKSDNDCPQDEDCVNGFCTKEKAPEAKPTPELEPLPLRIWLLTPITRPLPSSSGPPELPGLIAASVWTASAIG